MFGKVNSIYLQGMWGTQVSVEADVSGGLPGWSFVGYLASEVREAQDRVRTAIRNLGVELPPRKVTINLSPADLRKEGTGFDLAIAAAILTAYGIIPSPEETWLFLGELGLDGRIKGIPGALTLTVRARELGFTRLFLPEENLEEASMIQGIGLVGAGDLKSLMELLKGAGPIKEYERREGPETDPGQEKYAGDFSEVNGQKVLRRAAEVAVAGMHNLLMIGPAGSGKTMVARRLPTIFPAMTQEERIEISKIYSVCNLLSGEEPLIRRRPFRAPHHTVSAQALTGGGSRPKPGEISLATGGILFLDELPEMSRGALEALRQPLEERQVTISRVYGTCSYPADFQLVAAMNPCRCGHYPDLSRCTCTAGEVSRYLGKISGPLLDRMDICVEAQAVTYEEMEGKAENESSASIRARVEAARAIQRERFKGLSIRCNGEMGGGQIRRFCPLNKEESQFMEHIFFTLGISIRMYGKILKVARTAADLDGREQILTKDLSEAVSYVRIRQRYWKNG